MDNVKETLMEVTSFSKAIFDGFILKRGYFYGKDANGHPVATSTCVKNGKLAIYTKDENGRWQKSWMPIELAKKQYPNLELAQD